MKKHIKTALNNLMGFTYINPDTTHLFIQLFEEGINVGYYDKDDEPITIFNLNQYNYTYQFNEALCSKAFIKTYDEVGLDMLTEYYHNQYIMMLIKASEDEDNNN